MQRFCETIENSLNIYKALAKRRLGSVAGKEWGGLGLDKGFVYIREIFSLCFLFSVFSTNKLPTHLSHSPWRCLNLFAHLNVMASSSSTRGSGSLSPGGDLFRGERDTKRQNGKLQKCPIHKYLSVDAGCAISTSDSDGFEKGKHLRGMP